MYLFDSDILNALAKRRRPEALMARLAATPRVRTIVVEAPDLGSIRWIRVRRD